VDFYGNILKESGVKLVVNQTYDLLSHASAALVASGTATLETALMGVPQIVCYKGNQLSYIIAKQLVHVSYISLVNLISGKMLVPELIQAELNHKNLVNTLTEILEGGARRRSIIEGYTELKRDLGGSGASARLAGLMIQYLRQK
jgi:lipid-A-disaccharide synthase